MFRKHYDILVRVNFSAILKKNGKEVERREVHNVLTDVGADWLAHLVAWHSLGDPDVPVTQRRVRWIGVGTGTSQDELPGVVKIEVPTPVDDAGNYLAALDGSEFPDAEVPTARFFKEFGTGDITTVINPIVPITEAALFVDVHRVGEIGGYSDSPWGTLSTTLNPLNSDNPPVTYARFEPITKTRDYSLEFHWDYRFGT